MRLKLVKQSNFLGTVCDFYVDEEDNIYMSRTQIGYALQYKDPANAIKNIHNKNHKPASFFVKGAFMQKAFCYFTMQRTNVSSIKNHKSKIPIIYFF